MQSSTNKFLLKSPNQFGDLIDLNTLFGKQFFFICCCSIGTTNFGTARLRLVGNKKSFTTSPLI